MTTLRMKNVSTGEIRIVIFKSVDKLRKFLSQMYHKGDDKKTFYSSYTIKNGKKSVEVEEVLDGVGYDQNDESIALLRRYRIIPREDEYLSEDSNGN